MERRDVGRSVTWAAKRVGPWMPPRSTWRHRVEPFLRVPRTDSRWRPHGFGTGMFLMWCSWTSRDTFVSRTQCCHTLWLPALRPCSQTPGQLRKCGRWLPHAVVMNAQTRFRRRTTLAIVERVEYSSTQGKLADHNGVHAVYNREVRGNILVMNKGMTQEGNIRVPPPYTSVFS
jgi:hypothetical protein